MMRRVVFALVLIGAAFAGGAVINGPGLAWLQRNFAISRSIIVDNRSSHEPAGSEKIKPFPTASTKPNLTPPSRNPPRPPPPPWPRFPSPLLPNPPRYRRSTPSLAWLRSNVPSRPPLQPLTTGQLFGRR
jgi:hypothetical protein